MLASNYNIDDRRESCCWWREQKSIKLYSILCEMGRELGESFQSFDRNFFSVVIKVNLLFTREGGRKLRLLFFENEKGKKKVLSFI